MRIPTRRRGLVRAVLAPVAPPVAPPVALSLATCAAFALVAPGLGAGLPAQPVLGAGDDATLPLRGEVRVRVSPGFESATQRLGGPSGTGGGRVPLGTEFSTPAFGPAQLPILGPTRDTLRAITGAPALDLSLGRVAVAARVSAARVPTLVEVGVTRRVALAFTVRGVQTRTSVGVTVNADSVSGNFGLNPLRDATLGADAARANAAALNNLDTAIARLSARGTAAALVAQAQRFRDGLLAVYGSGGTGANPSLGALVVPIAGSDAQAAVAARLAALAAQFAAQGVGLNPLALPAASRQRFGTQALLDLLLSPASGVGGGVVAPLASYNRGGLGEFDAVANVQLLDTFGAAGTGPLAPLRGRVAPGRGLRLRSTAGAGWRLGVGNGPLPFLLFDAPPSERMTAALVRSATDVAVGRRFSASVVARAALPVADRIELRVAAPGQPYAEAFRVRQVGRRLGREVELEVTPRYAFNDAFAVVAQGYVRDRAATRFTGTFTATPADTGLGDVTFDAAPLGIGTGGREARGGVGLAYSTVASHARGRARLPVELSFVHSRFIAGAAGNVRNVTTEQLSVRVGARLFGR